MFDYIDGGADDERGLMRNLEALERFQLRPKRLAATTTADTSALIFGERFAAPLIVAPLGLTGLVWPQGDLCLARAAADMKVPFTLSTASTSGIAEVAQSCRSDKWFQLYVFGKRAIAEQLIHEAQDAGYRVLMVTVDVPINGNRLRDRRNGFVIPFRPRSRLIADALRCPSWLLQLARYGTPTLVNMSRQRFVGAADDDVRALAERRMDGTLSWESIAWLREHWSGPIIVKGVMTAEDAQRACDHGADGVVVSNHGGRQLSRLPASIDMLEEVVTAVRRRIAVFIDSGFRTGSDVVIALALGADAVLIGRPLLYGLATAGERGARAVLESLRDDIENTLVLAGFSKLSELTSACVHRHLGLE